MSQRKRLSYVDDSQFFNIYKKIEKKENKWIDYFLILVCVSVVGFLFYKVI